MQAASSSIVTAMREIPGYSPLAMGAASSQSRHFRYEPVNGYVKFTNSLQSSWIQALVLETAYSGSCCAAVARPWQKLLQMSIGPNPLKDCVNLDGEEPHASLTGLYTESASTLNWRDQITGEVRNSWAKSRSSPRLWITLYGPSSRSMCWIHLSEPLAIDPNYKVRTLELRGYWSSEVGGVVSSFKAKSLLCSC